MKKIILDTNFLMIPYEFRVDIFSEFDRIFSLNYRLYIYEESINELKNISEMQKGRDKLAAKFALKLIKLKNIGVIKSEHKDVDSIILENADENAIIATQDSNLRRELRKMGASVILLRQKKYLTYIERKLYK